MLGKVHTLHFHDQIQLVCKKILIYESSDLTFSTLTDCYVAQNAVDSLCQRPLPALEASQRPFV